jgi:hypothetical protein
MSSDALAKALGTSGQNVRRYEGGHQELTIDWLERFAHALGVRPDELLVKEVNTSPRSWRNEVEPTDAGNVPAVRHALSEKGIGLYKVISDSVAESGIPPGEIITVDESNHASPQTGDIVLISMMTPARSEILALRAFMAPSLLVTNRRGPNVAIRVDDASVAIAIKGVVIRRTPQR